MLAVTSQTISFDIGNGITYMVPKGATINVDPLEGIGFYRDMHFFIEAEEYTLFSSNSHATVQ